MSETDALSERPVLSRAQYEKYLDSLGEEELERVGQIAFESLQGLKGSIYFGGNFDKLKWIRDTKWDLLVIDEAHEGVYTKKTDRAFLDIERRFTLHLSGTPFRAIADGKFRAEQIYNWSYADEQTAKLSWEGEAANPYEGLPRLSLYTYQLSKMVAERAATGLDLSEDEHAEYAFDLNEFFRTEKGKFVYEKDVRRFLDALTTLEKFPFSTEELRGELKHTFWLLSRVDSARALAKMLAEHPVFRDYEVVLAAGDGKTDESEDNEAARSSLSRVREAIRTHERTITLSVGQLTTGITVKPWTAVLMLSNMRSPAEYMQAAFRVQNPYSYEEGGRLYQKTNAYVFDFSPERTLIVFDEFANSLISGTAAGRGTKEEHEENIRRLLNFFPVLAEDEEGRMVELDAERVLALPRAIKAEEVVRRGFMSNFLFQNIGNIFSAPGSVRAILEKLTPAEEQGDKKNAHSMAEADEVLIDEAGEVEIPNEIVIGRTRELFGEKIYEELEDKTEGLLAADEAMPSEELNREVAKNIAETLRPKLVGETAKQYGLKKAETDRLLKQQEKKIFDSLQEVSERHEQEKKVLAAEFKEKEQKAESKEELQAVNEDYEQKLKESLTAYNAKVLETAKQAIEETPAEITRTLEVREEEKKKKGVEDEVRAHLRGFSRTVPAFIMAYSEEAHGGGRDLRLGNFDDYTPDDVFLEVTGISEDDFRFLRDGGERENPVTGETESFAGGFFNEVVFDEAVREFLAKKERLNDYFAEAAREDIFDYIPPQRTNQIFTPREVVKRMADELERENPGIFNDPEKTFVDFYMKSGLYITEIVKRLYRSPALKAAYPERGDRLKHILERQVFGFAPTKIIHSIAIAYIFGFDERAKNISRANFICLDTTEAVKEGQLAELVEKYFGGRA